MSDEEIQKVPESLRRRCPECGGAGECRSSHRYTCYDCRGRGWVPVAGVAELVGNMKKGG